MAQRRKEKKKIEERCVITGLSILYLDKARNWEAKATITCELVPRA